jgi:tRNA dimethylallyltransferase
MSKSRRSRKVFQIDETHQRRQIPIVVGGTSYWIQHLIFPGRLAGFNDQLADASFSSSANKHSERLAKAVAQLPPDLLSVYQNLETQGASAAADSGSAFTLHRLLAALDPPVARRWHWKDTRKVLRSLELIKQAGCLSSEIISEQSQTVSEPR